uniref:Uncharacterized protein n=1 Tax=Timspurckia oligopyrenoides TaxID=708627 RepID=A0A7S0ZIM7_9RHOD|mmetsp:Transcript_6796/g.12153  ORF Transcript_6796/g.12153 Transcript_6796/m.12153 type:complete len:585 (+) Transcript_6796:262-2016(+)|eukprot:CAMPEP_0182452320 /NCGR_PEP_ID=MMETSP1172-20130603/44185_1 /TAXON_ID=708627 /ORGANISM="Timspurckia oligopyrenoides, Strain CCMP3278" /LENGTH=584 /DNA_ID=CAMNT_0024650147 /DNA_START=892 /DNA_END=2646 /DNA_ORIENTATION=+
MNRLAALTAVVIFIALFCVKSVSAQCKCTRLINADCTILTPLTETTCDQDTIQCTRCVCDMNGEEDCDTLSGTSLVFTGSGNTCAFQESFHAVCPDTSGRIVPNGFSFAGSLNSMAHIVSDEFYASTLLHVAASAGSSLVTRDETGFYIGTTVNSGTGVTSGRTMCLTEGTGFRIQGFRVRSNSCSSASTLVIGGVSVNINAGFTGDITLPSAQEVSLFVSVDLQFNTAEACDLSLNSFRGIVTNVFSNQLRLIDFSGQVSLLSNTEVQDNIGDSWFVHSDTLLSSLVQFSFNGFYIGSTLLSGTGLSDTRLLKMPSTSPISSFCDVTDLFIGENRCAQDTTLTLTEYNEYRELIPSEYQVVIGAGYIGAVALPTALRLNAATQLEIRFGAALTGSDPLCDLGIKYARGSLFVQVEVQDSIMFNQQDGETNVIGYSVETDVTYRMTTSSTNGGVLGNLFPSFISVRSGTNGGFLIGDSLTAGVVPTHVRYLEMFDLDNQFKVTSIDITENDCSGSTGLVFESPLQARNERLGIAARQIGTVQLNGLVVLVGKGSNRLGMTFERNLGTLNCKLRIKQFNGIFMPL